MLLASTINAIMMLCVACTSIWSDMESLSQAMVVLVYCQVIYKPTVGLHDLTGHVLLANTEMIGRNQLIFAYYLFMIVTLAEVLYSL